MDETREGQKQAKRYSKEKQAATNRQKMLQILQQRDMDALLERQRETNLNIDELLTRAAGKLRHEDVVGIAHMSGNIQWLETYIATLHIQEHIMFK